MTDIWTKLGIAASAEAISQPLSMQNDNALSITLIVFAGALGTAGLEVWESNDLENWQQKGTLVFASQGVGSTMDSSTYKDITSQYVRFKATAGANATVLGLTVNTAQL